MKLQRWTMRFKERSILFCFNNNNNAITLLSLAHACDIYISSKMIQRMLINRYKIGKEKVKFWIIVDLFYYMNEYT